MDEYAEIFTFVLYPCSMFALECVHLFNIEKKTMKNDTLYILDVDLKNSQITFISNTISLILTNWL
jgi:hypothetical protein